MRTSAANDRAVVLAEVGIRAPSANENEAMPKKCSSKNDGMRLTLPRRFSKLAVNSRLVRVMTAKSSKQLLQGIL